MENLFYSLAYFKFLLSERKHFRQFAHLSESDAQQIDRDIARLQQQVDDYQQKLAAAMLKNGRE